MKSGATETSFYYLFQHLNKPNDVDIVRTTEEAYRSTKRYKIIWAHDNCDQFVHHNLPEVINEIDLIVCPSTWAKNQFVRFNRAPENKIVVIPNGVDPMFAPPLNRKSKTAIFFSAPHKGIVPLPEIWKRVISKHPDANLKVFSSMDLYGNCKNHDHEDGFMMRAIEELKSLPNVLYSPCIDRNDLVEHVKDAAFFVHPNVWEETFCVSMAEAMASGCFPIVSDIGALREISFDRGKYIKMNGKNSNRGWVVNDIFVEDFSRMLCDCFHYFDLEPQTFYAATKDLSDITRYWYDWKKIASYWKNVILTNK